MRAFAGLAVAGLGRDATGCKRIGQFRIAACAFSTCSTTAGFHVAKSKPAFGRFDGGDGG